LLRDIEDLQQLTGKPSSHSFTALRLLLPSMATPGMKISFHNPIHGKDNTKDPQGHESLRFKYERKQINA